MMASAMLRAAAVLGDAAARAHALATLDLPPARERRSRTPCAHTPGGVTGLLDDQVQAAAAALDAYEATGDREWLAWAERLMERVWTDYWDDAARRTVRHRAGPERRGGPAARAGEAGAGHAHTVAQRGRRHRRACGCTS